MSAVEPFYKLLPIRTSTLSREELIIFEAELFICLYKKLNEHFRENYENFFKILKLSKEMENMMLELEFIKNITNDIVSLGEYTLEGIAYHTDIPEEVLQEILTGSNTNPSLHLSRKIIELHRLVRPDLYQNIVHKVINESLKNIQQ